MKILGTEKCEGKTKSYYLKIFKSQYLVEFLRYGYNFLHVIITFIGFKLTFSNIEQSLYEIQTL